MRVMKRLSFIVYILSVCNALKQETFDLGLFNKDAITAPVTTLSRLSKLDCATQCLMLKDEICQGFYISNHNGLCNLVNNASGLFPVPKISSAKQPIFIANSISKCQRWTLAGFSFNIEESPQSFTYSWIHPSIGDDFGTAAIVERDGSLTIGERGGTSFFSWGFDNSTPTLIPNLSIRNHGHYPLIASQNGKVFILGGKNGPKLVDIYENGKVRNVQSQPPVGLAAGCASFLPGDDNLVYYGGGDFIPWISPGRTNNFWTYDITSDTFTQIPSLPDYPDTGLAAHGCVGVEAKSGEKMFIVMGGLNEVSGITGSAQTHTKTFKFSPSTQTWSGFTELPRPTTHFTSVYWMDHIYIFGGLNYHGPPWTSENHNSVLKLYLHEDSFIDSPRWQMAGNTSESWFPVVVPYA